MNPGASEDGTDPVDDDCDGSPLTRRAYVVGFEPAYTNDWSTVGNVSLYTPGLLWLQPTATTAAGIALKRDLVWPKGRVTVNVRFTQAPTTACSVIVAGPTTSYTQSLGTPAGAETVTVEFAGILPGQVITDVKLSCAGAGAAKVDWLTLQNGPYVWGPLMDIGVSFSTMGFPEAGHGSFVRMSEGTDPDGELRFMGGDVGGIAWSEDGYAWYTANGSQEDLNTQALGGVWDAWSPGVIGGAWFTAILVGNRPGGENGGLFYTADITDPFQRWTMVPGPAGAPSGDGGIGATKWDQECPGGGGNQASSGKLLVEDPHDGLILVGSTTADYPGVWAWDPSSPASPPIQAIDDSFLPSDVTPYVSALAVVGDHLIVGYRLACGGDPDGPGHDTALYDCADPDGASAGPMTCTPMLDDGDGLAPLDVRDIEVLPIDYDGPGDPTGIVILYVADGGTRFDGATTGDPNYLDIATADESTVYEVRIDAAGGYTVQDTDTQDPLPVWAVDGAGTPITTGYRSGGNCGQGSGATYGDLVAPESGSEYGRELATILLTPGHDALFAFYPQTAANRDYGCVRAFRAELTGTIPLDWRPFQGWEGGTMGWTGTTHPKARRDAVGVYGANMDVEPLLEVWGLSSATDAAWEPPVSGETEASLLTHGLTTWRVLHSDEMVGTPGWDTTWPTNPTSEVLDALPIELAWDGTSEVYQSSQGKSLAVYRGGPRTGAGQSGYLDKLIGGGNGDYKMGLLYGRDSSGTRQASDHPCPVWQWRGAAVYATAVWQDPADEGTEPDLWMPMVASDGDASRVRGILHADDLDNLDDAASWCWDSFTREIDDGDPATDDTISGIPSNYVKDAFPTDGVYELLCQDGGLLDTTSVFRTCNQNTDVSNPDSFDMTYADIGNVWRIVSVERDYAIGAAGQGLLVDDTYGGDGLWVLHHNGTDGMEYTHVDFDPSVVCTEAEAFDEGNQFQLTVDEEALAAAAGSGEVTVYFTAYYKNTVGCSGAWQITFNFKDAAPVSTWTEITPDAATCPFAPYNIRGARPTRDGRFVYIWGGDGVTDDGGVCRVDMDGTTATELAFPATPWLAVWDVMPHPHLDDVIWVGVQGANQDDDPTSGDGGVFIAQRRFRPGLGVFPTGSWAWGSVRFGYYDLEERRVVDVDWGPGWGAYPGDDPDDPRDDQLTNVYVTALGGGWWDGAVVLE